MFSLEGRSLRQTHLFFYNIHLYIYYILQLNYNEVLIDDQNTSRPLAARRTRTYTAMRHSRGHAYSNHNEGESTTTTPPRRSPAMVSRGSSGAWKHDGIYNLAMRRFEAWLRKPGRAVISAEPKMMLDLSTENLRTTSSGARG